MAADAAVRLGDWETADAATREAIRVAGETGQASWHGYALTTRARLAGARGSEAEGREAAAAALAIAEAGGISSGLRFVHGALGFLELSVERVDAAIAALEAIERLVEGSGLDEPTLVPWAPDLAEAYARSGRCEDARRVLAMLERQATRPARSTRGWRPPAAAACSPRTSTSRSPPRSRCTTAARCRSSAPARCWRTAGGCTARAGAPSRASGCARRSPASSGSAPRHGADADAAPPAATAALRAERRPSS